MIDLLSKEQVEKIIKEREKHFVLGLYNFFILTPLNHTFLVYRDKDIRLLDPKDSNFVLTLPDSPHILELYGLRYTVTERYVTFQDSSKDIESFYETALSSPEYLFYGYPHEVEILIQELRHRGLI